MRIYLDLCVYNRPFDDQSQPRIFIEATEFLLILSEVVGRELQKSVYNAQGQDK